MLCFLCQSSCYPTHCASQRTEQLLFFPHLMGNIENRNFGAVLKSAFVCIYFCDDGPVLGAQEQCQLADWSSSSLRISSIVTLPTIKISTSLRKASIVRSAWFRTFELSWEVQNFHLFYFLPLLFPNKGNIVWVVRKKAPHLWSTVESPPPVSLPLKIRFLCFFQPTKFRENG